jgi:hypothetical protein
VNPFSIRKSTQAPSLHRPFCTPPSLSRLFIGNKNSPYAPLEVLRLRGISQRYHVKLLFKRHVSAEPSAKSSNLRSSFSPNLRSVLEDALGLGKVIHPAPSGGSSISAPSKVIYLGIIIQSPQRTLSPPIPRGRFGYRQIIHFRWLANEGIVKLKRDHV